jgi:hypothetical protein
MLIELSQFQVIDGRVSYPGLDSLGGINSITSPPKVGGRANLAGFGSEINPASSS